jgi:Holliday junction resolvasome RuvABC DNA-binding subunit
VEGLIETAVDSEPESGLVESTVAALMALGYSRVEAEAAVRGALKDRDGSDQGVESLVRQALAGL